MNDKVTVRDLSGLSAENIVGVLKRCFQNSDISNRGYCYCGITNDVERRLAEHERDDWKINRILAVVDCGSKDKASRVEELMARDNFDIGKVKGGGNGAGDDTTLIYLVHKGPTVIKRISEYIGQSLTEFIVQILKR